MALLLTFSLLLAEVPFGFGNSVKAVEEAQNTQALVRNVGRNRARLFYALLGLLMIGTAVYFYMEVQKTIA